MFTFIRIRLFQRFYRQISSQAVPNGESLSPKWQYIYKQFSKDFYDLSQELERRRYNKRLILLAGTGILAYATYGFFRNWATKEVVQFSGQTFDNEEFKKHATTFITYLCSSPKVQSDVTNLLTSCVNQLILSPKIQSDVTKLLHLVVTNLINDPTIQTEIYHLVAKAVGSETVVAASKITVDQIVNELLNAPEYENFRLVIQNYLFIELQNQLSNKENKDKFSEFVKAALLALFWKSS